MLLPPRLRAPARMIFPRKQVDAISVLSLQQTDPRGRTPLVFPSLVVCMSQCNLVLCGIKVSIPSSFRVMLLTGLRGGTQPDPFILFMSCVFTDNRHGVMVCEFSPHCFLQALALLVRARYHVYASLWRWLPTLRPSTPLPMITSQGYQ